jgi:hypothetical protein
MHKRPAVPEGPRKRRRREIAEGICIATFDSARSRVDLLRNDVICGEARLLARSGYVFGSCPRI